MLKKINRKKITSQKFPVSHENGLSQQSQYGFATALVKLLCIIIFYLDMHRCLFSISV